MGPKSSVASEGAARLARGRSWDDEDRFESLVLTLLHVFPW